MQSEIQTLLLFAIQLCLKSKEIISKNNKQIETKENVTDLVTLTDKAVEDYIITEIKKKYPHHLFIGEESLRQEFTDQPTWIIDPIDGTTNFVHSFPYFCVSIGLCINKEPIVGVVFNPLQNQLFYAGKNLGCYLSNDQFKDIGDGKKLFSTGDLPTSLSHTLVLTEYGASKQQDILQLKLDNIKRVIDTARGIRSVGSAAMSMALIAQGVADLYYEYGTHCWDICAGVVLVRESGGIVEGVNSEFGLMKRNLVCMRGGNGDYKVLKEFNSLMVHIDYPSD
ncbi:Inositol monophosphatase 2 [Boothiomyces macroporosus]|uniref:Inositol-1-monophosphatase n=1 Tax=Boothiomyces macroporosus TaxID=261099 RepID=A0AAD5UG62_9FUNG|nr:Inositol monophosphatase 2 [Boothiomyces macroporosus]